MNLVDRILKMLFWLLILFIYIPIIVMVIFSFNPARSKLVLTGFTMENYISLFNNVRVWESFINSIWTAGVVVVASLFLGILMAYAVVRYRPRGSTFLDSLIMVPIIIPEIVEAVTLVIFLIIIGFKLSPLTIILGHIAFDAPLAYLVLKARFQGWNREYEEAAMTLGADEITTFIKITIPLMMPAILAAAFLTFIWSYDDFIKTFFTRPTGFETLPVYIWNRVARGRLDLDINALSTIIVAISILFAYVRMKLIKE
ncbi:TPA: ABC transporter permease [Candidatus Geothermarchaeota archaeon]|nr:ABC transporter permease [Candidatus Geothermarchaeota archaeon]